MKDYQEKIQPAIAHFLGWEYGIVIMPCDVSNRGRVWQPMATGWYQPDNYTECRPHPPDPLRNAGDAWGLQCAILGKDYLIKIVDLQRFRVVLSGKTRFYGYGATPEEALVAAWAAAFMGEEEVS